MNQSFGTRQALLDGASADALASPRVAAFLASGAVFTLDADRVWVGWGERRSFASRLEAERAGATGALFAPDFYLEAPLPWFAYAAWDIVGRQAFRNWLAQAEAFELKLEALDWIEPELGGFAAAFARVQELIRERALDKAVPVVFARAPRPAPAPSSSSSWAFAGAALARAVDRAVGAPASLRGYGAWADGAGLLGASPETLFRQPRPDRVETVALAGTKPRPAAADDLERAREEFLADPKERAEHEFVADDLRRALGRLASEVHLSDMHVSELPTLLHLRTDVSAELKAAASFEDLVAALHPTPALGVAPREAGLSALRAIDDPAKRARFGAPFGIWCASPFVSDCLVAIRCAQWDAAGASIGSGCGVVAASQLESEWQELRAKRDSVRKVLGL